MPGRIVVENWRELNRAFKETDKETRKRLRDEQKDAAEPVRSTAAQLAASRIRNIGPRWAQMRTGVTQTVVYVAPQQRNRGGSRRPNLAPLLMEQAMEPALDQRSAEIEANFDRVLERIATDFNRGGLV